jgi:hypothetical protein
MKVSEAVMLSQQNQKTQQAPLEIFGSRFNQRIERAFDRDSKKLLSLALIQRVYRGHLARLHYLALRKQRSSLLLQTYLRAHLARRHVYRL